MNINNFNYKNYLKSKRKLKEILEYFSSNEIIQLKGVYLKEAFPVILNINRNPYKKKYIEEDYKELLKYKVDLIEGNVRILDDDSLEPYIEIVVILPRYEYDYYCTGDEY